MFTIESDMADKPGWPERKEAGFDFEEEAKAILKSELKRNRLTYAELADRFTRLGVPMTEPTLRNKISRGSFSAAFFLHCLGLIGSQTIHLTSLDQHLPGFQPRFDLEPPPNEARETRDSKDFRESKDRTKK